MLSDFDRYMEAVLVGVAAEAGGLLLEWLVNWVRLKIQQRRLKKPKSKKKNKKK